MNNGRGSLRQVLDVLNVVLILAFLLKMHTGMKSCGINVATTEEKHTTLTISAPENISSSPTVSPTTISPPIATAPPLYTTALPAPATPIIDFQAFLRDGQQTNICILANSGLGSQLIQMIAQKIIYNDKSFHFMVDDNQYGYKWDSQTGVLRGFFDPSFPVLGPNDYEKEIQGPFHMPGMPHIMSMRAFKTSRSADSKILVQWAINEEFRRFVQKNYGVEGLPLYHRFVSEACSNLQFNARAKAVIQQVHTANDIPNFRNSHSVAFHVRRGDKVTTGESRAFSGSDYVEKLIGLKNINTTSITDCFVASDSVGAVQELRQSLIDHNIHCKFHSLATFTEEQMGIRKTSYSDQASTIQFLAEISGLLDATYFIGTFNSNVGSLVALLRKCHYYGAPHFAHSYGVDREGWFYRA